jgi:hypothetical protein
MVQDIEMLGFAESILYAPLDAMGFSNRLHALLNVMGSL